MNGVEILNQVQVHGDKVFPLLLFGVLAVVAFFISILLYLDNDVVFFVPLCGGILSFLIFLAVAVSEPVNYIKYQITVSDSVYMQEFNNKYEILSQDGKIYTVKEKVNPNEQ